MSREVIEPCERCAAPLVVHAEIVGGRRTAVWMEVRCHCEAAGVERVACMPRVEHTADRCRERREQDAAFGRHPARFVPPTSWDVF